MALAAARESGEHEVRPYGDKRLSRPGTRPAPTTDARVLPCRGLLHFPRLRTHGKAGIGDALVALTFRSAILLFSYCADLKVGATSDWVQRARRLGGARSAGVRQSNNECRKPA